MFTIADYCFTQLLYESRNSRVYRGYQISDRQPVVLKMLQDTDLLPDRMAWFQREYEVTRNLNLDGVVKAYAFVRDRHHPIIVLEDFGGDSLTRLGLAGQLELKEFFRLAIAITQILGDLHIAHIIHKDINPSNIVFNPATGVVKIIDFGISAVLSQESSLWRHPNLLEGTLAYLSPEQTGRMNRTIDYRSDFYSLGVTFYELLTGQLPFQSDDPLELIYGHIAQQPPPLKNKEKIPQILSDLVTKLMAKNAENRYQSALGLTTDLENCLHQLQTTGEITPFPLAQHDRSERLQIPQKLYGRQPEIERLLAAFQRVVESDEPNQHFHSELILISGYSGVGKSALVREVYRPLTEKRSNFIAGKFDQYLRDIPYSAFAQAFNDFCHHLLSEQEVVFRAWREKILTAVGHNGQVLIDVMPALEQIIGQQNPVAQVGAREAQNRFNLVFQSFIQAICQPEHPLVLFIDDLQWADSASLNLLKAIMSVSEAGAEHLRKLGSLLVIGAYRDNEVNENHPLMAILADIQAGKGTISHIHLNNLLNTNINELISEALGCSFGETQTLADSVYAKTQGNPFFTIEFLKSLSTEGLLKFNPHQQRWQWSVSQIDAKHITDNVVELMAGKIIQLAIPCQTILQLAACIGDRFDLSTLAIISQRQPADLLTDLFPALEARLVVPLSEKYKLFLLDPKIASREVQFKFLHDRVQQAAYSLIENYQRQETHLKIGRLLLADVERTTHQGGLKDKIFDIVNQFNEGLVLIGDLAERIQLAELNLIAGQKAKSTNAYGAAVKYLNIGLSLLPDQGWQTHYELTLNLHIEAIEAEYLNTDYSQVEAPSQIVIQQAKNILDVIRVYQVNIQFYSAQNKLNRAVETALHVLNRLGFSLSNTPPDIPDIEALNHLPLMTDPYPLAAMRILMSVWGTAIIVNPELVPPMAFTMVNLSIRYGNSPLAPFAYAYYGFNLCSVLSDIELGYRFGKLALQLLDKFYHRETQCKVNHVFNAFIRHWKEPVRQSISGLEATIQMGLETGDLEYTCYAAMQYICYSFLSGLPLESLGNQQAKYILLIDSLKQEFQLYYAKIWGQLVVNLSSRVTNPLILQGDYFDETKEIPILQANKNDSSLFCFYIAKTILHYLFQEYEQANTYAVLATEYEPAIASLLPRGQHPFYFALVLLARYATVNPNQQIEFLRQIEDYQNQLQEWATHAPSNYQHKYELVAAEKARILGDYWQATQHYERAIQGAKENEYLQEEALAYELAAAFYLEQGMTEFAQLYIAKAQAAYTRWQAWAKVEDLITRYSAFLSSEPTPVISSGTIISSEKQATDAVLDFASVVKSSQAIAREIELDQLLTTLMTIVIQNAGAQVGCLILKQNEQWVVQATSSVEGQQALALQGVVIHGSDRTLTEPLLATGIVRYVIRTQQTVVLNDAAHEGVFVQEPYILTNHPKSILCMPLLNQGNLSGVLYLENNLTLGAFTPERLEVLKILSLQAAISLENAKLYASLRQSESQLERQVAAQTEALRQSEAQRRLTLELTEIGSWDWDIATGDIVWNDNHFHLFGLVPGEVMPNYQLWRDRVHPEDIERVEQAVFQALDTHTGFEAEYRVILPDGSIRWLFARGRAMYDETNQPVRMLGVLFDISERQAALRDRTLAEEKIRKSEAALREAQRIARMGNWEVDLVTQHLSWSDELFQMFGLNPADPEPGYAEHFNYIHPEDLAKLQYHLEQAMTQGMPYEIDLRFFRADGTLGYMEAKGEAVRNETGQIVRVLGTAVDITERKQIELELHKAKEAAEIANRAKSTFLANMSHELRTPLNAILGFAQIMERDTSLTLEQRENLQIIHRSGDHLLSLISDILDLSKIEAGRITVEESNFDLKQMLQSLAAMFRQKAIAKGLQLHLEMAPNVPSVVQADASKLRQVLINLLGNAVKFTEQGSISLRVKVEPQEASELEPEPLFTAADTPVRSLSMPHTAPYILQFDVEDTGIGIAPDELETIFDAFAQSCSGKKTPGGTGLGLTISRNLARLMKGEILVSSTLGQGSIFSLSLPVKLANAADVNPVETTRQVLGLLPGQPSYRVLVVDDQPENRLLLARLMAQLGLEVQQAANGEEAFLLWQQWHPDLIWMDIRMPGIDGYQVTQRIRASINGQDPVIIALTAQASTSDRTLALSAGCTDFLSKPFREAELFAKMQMYLGLRYLYADEQPTNRSNPEEFSSPNTLTPESLTVMPSMWIAQFHQAALHCDDEEILSLIEQIPSENAALIAGLSHLAHNYDFTILMQLSNSCDRWE